MDLTLRIDGDTIKSVLFEKDNNLHLYLPAKSSHPPGVLYGLISGSVYRAFALCSEEADAITHIRSMFRYLRARGYERSKLLTLFHKALRNRKQPQPLVPVDATSDGNWFFKLTYHPQDPPSHLICKAWNREVAEPPLSTPLKDLDLKFNPIGHRRFIVCCKRPANLGNMLSYRKLRPDTGRPVSSFCEEL